MSQDRINMLMEYIKAGISPILVEDLPVNIFDDAIIIDSNCDDMLLNGHYENTDFVAPKWYYELLEQSKTKMPMLVIKDINKVSIEVQSKFGELLKYKKISTFDLPVNCIIIVTCSNLKGATLNKDIYSLMAHI